MSVLVVDVGAFSAILLIVCVGFLLSMKASMSACWGGFYGLLSRILLFDRNTSMLEFVDISLVARRIFGAEGEE